MQRAGTISRGIALPTYEAILALAATLTIFDQTTSTYIPFRLNGEQKRVLRMVLRYRRIVIAKPRQIGSSTIFCLLLMTIAMINPGLPEAIVGDSWDTADGLIEKIRHWLVDDMGVALETQNVRSLVLPNRASIVAKTANSRAGADDGAGTESKVGRSKTFAVVYATEMAFWSNARATWASLTGTATMNQVLLVDSTGSPGDTLYKELLEDAVDINALETEEDPGGWVTTFIGFESHKAYRSPPETIDDATWARLKKEYGFTRRESAAWWQWKLITDIKDAFRMLREFPVLLEHMFSFRLGQHITKWKVATDVDVQDEGLWNIYRDPIDDDPLVMGVDTALGLGDDSKGIKNETDASTIYLMGWRTGLPYATYRTYGTPIVQFTTKVLEVIEEYDPVACVVETNGCGTALYGGVMHLACVEELNAGNLTGEVQRRRDAFRDKIEAGLVPVGPHMLEEIKQSTVKAKKFADGRIRGYFAGHDDTLSSGSFCENWRAENPFPEPEAGEIDRGRFFARPAKRKQVTH